MKLLDTSVAVDHLRGERAAVDLMRALVNGGESVAASEIVRFELLGGARDGELEALELFFSAFSWLPVDEDIARTAGSFARTHRRANRGIDDADYLIAATAVRYEADLLTRNVRHFPMLTGLGPAY